MVRSATRSFFLRKHRRWPHSPYTAKWELFFNQQQAMQAFKRAITAPPRAPASPDKPHPLLSSLVFSFSLYKCDPTPQAYTFLFKTLAKTSQLHYIPSVLDHVERLENFKVPESVFADLIKLFGDSNQTQMAIEVFNRIPKFNCAPSTLSLDALLSVLCQNKENLQLVPGILLKCQDLNIRLQKSSFRILITALCRIKEVGFAFELFNCMVNENGFVVDEELCSLLLSSACEIKGVSSGQVIGLLGELRSLGFCPGMVDYTHVIRFLVKGGLALEALGVLKQMKLEGIKPDIVCYSMVLDCVVAAGGYSKADELFDELLVFGLVPNVYTYSAYITGLCKQGKVEAAIKMVACMEELGCKPNVITYNVLLDFLCKNGELSKAREFMREIGLKGIGLTKQAYGIIDDGLAKSGQIIEACNSSEELLHEDL